MIRANFIFPSFTRLCLLLFLTLVFFNSKSNANASNDLVIQSPKIPILPLNPSKELVNACSIYTIDRLQGYLDLRFLKCLDDNLRNEKTNEDSNLICEKSINKDETDLKTIYQICLEYEVFEDNYSCHKHRIKSEVASDSD